MVVELLLEKAERFIASAHILAEHGDLDGSASRLYYAMFFVAEALLETKGLAFSSHKSVQAAYGLHFAKTQELDPRFHQALLYRLSAAPAGRLFGHKSRDGWSGRRLDSRCSRHSGRRTGLAIRALYVARMLVREPLEDTT